jgi:hypothetical protein
LVTADWPGLRRDSGHAMFQIPTRL